MGQVVSTVIGAVSGGRKRKSTDDGQDDHNDSPPQSRVERSPSPAPPSSAFSSSSSSAAHHHTPVVDQQPPPSQIEKPNSPPTTPAPPASASAAQNSSNNSSTVHEKNSSKNDNSRQHQQQQKRANNDQSPPFKKQKTPAQKQAKAEERNRKRKKKRGIPVRGKKDFDVDEQSPQQRQSLEESRADWFNSLKRQRHVSMRALSRGVWRAAQKRTEVTEVRAKWTRTMGRHENGKLYINVEETVFLVEHAQLEVQTESGVVLSLQDAYQLLEQCDFSIDKYLVFAHLRRANYVVLRSPVNSSVNPHAAAAADAAKASTFAPTVNPDEIQVGGEDEDGDEDGKDGADDNEIFDYGDGNDDEERELEKPVNSEEEEEANVAPPPAIIALSSSNSQKQDILRSSISADDLKPLVEDVRSVSDYEIRKRSQLVPRTDFKNVYYHPAPSAPALNLAVDFDVWSPERIYKKKNPGRPNFRLTVCNFFAPPPSVLALERLTRLAAPVQLKICVICQGAINFYSFVSKPPEAGDTASLLLEGAAAVSK